MSDTLLFGDLFYGLREAGLKIGLSEWMSLMEAMQKGGVEPNLTDFYLVSRAILIKSEAHYDVFDQVFAAVFGKGEFPTKELERVLNWLRDTNIPRLSPEQMAELEALPLDELRKQFEERLREQKERHDGGSRWVGTGGRSPFGHGGRNPAGVRVGGGGGGRSAIQIATARKFQQYRWDRVLDTRSMAVALKKLRRLSRKHSELELDVDESIDKTCQNAGELTLAFNPPRKNEARVLLLMDVGGSMDPYAEMVEQLFSAANSLHHWRKFEAYAFHNCVYERLEPGRPHEEESILTAELLRERPGETFVIFVGDAYMAPTELLDAHGAIHYYHHHRTPGMVWLHRFRERFPRSIWLNPIPKRGWHGWTIKMIGEIFPMYELTVQGLDEAMNYLVKGKPKVIRSLKDMYPDMPQLYAEYGLDEDSH